MVGVALPCVLGIDLCRTYWERAAPWDVVCGTGSRRLAARAVWPCCGGRAIEEAVTALCLAADREDHGLLRFLHEEVGAI